MMRIARNKTLNKKNFHSIHVKETRLNNTFIWSKDLIIVPSHQMTPPGRVGFLSGSRESPWNHPVVSRNFQLGQMVCGMHRFLINTYNESVVQ